MSVSFCGRITNDIKFFDAKDNKVAKFGVAINIYTPKGEKTVFKDVVVFGSQVKYLAAVQEGGNAKGSPVFVTGVIDIDSYQDKNTEYVKASQVSVLSKGAKPTAKTEDKSSDLPF